MQYTGVIKMIMRLGEVFLRALGKPLVKFLSSLGDLTSFILKAIYHCFVPPFYFKLFFKQVLDIGFYSLPVVGLTTLFAGMVIALQTYSGFSGFKAESVIASVVLISVTRELAPVLSALMVAGRIGAAMAAEILPGKTVLEALNTDLVCDAINTAMRELFLQIVYGRTQSAFSEGGLIIGAGLEDLGKGLRSQVGTLYGTLAKGPRYLEMAEGYIKTIALDKNDEICGYEFVHMGKFMDEIKKGTDANEALKKVTGTYGRFTAEQGAVKHIDPRHE